MKNEIEKILDEHASTLEAVRRTLVPKISQVADIVIGKLRSGGKILWCGNGGSAADAQHMAAELIGRFKIDRPPIASIALTTDTSILTCVGNDYSFEEIFSRQVEALAGAQDVLIGISTSGNSKNVIRAVEKARSRGTHTICMLGRDGGHLKAVCDVAVVVPSNDTARIQEMHTLIAHILCDMIERNVVKS